MKSGRELMKFWNKHQKDKSEEQIHYESLASYLKWIVGIAGTLIAVITAVALNFTYTNMKDMRDEYQTAINKFESRLDEVKNEAKETTRLIKEDSQSDIKVSKANTETQLKTITDQTREIALRQTNDQISDIFKSDKIQNIIEYQATKEIKAKVNEIVSNETKNLLPINDAASSMREGSRLGMIRLKSFFLNSSNTRDSLKAKTLYDLILDDYEVQYAPYYNNLDYVDWEIHNRTIIQGFIKSPGIPVFSKIKIIDGKLPKDNEEKETLAEFVRYAREGNDLNIVAWITIRLSAIAGIKFDFFNETQIDKWYNSLKPFN